jgi:site-specific DNA-methyltransferase (adenine-specific)
MSNVKMFKHQWIWNKKQSGSFANAKFAPLKIFEEINVFAHGKVTYFPQMKTGKPRKKGGAKKPCETMSKCLVGYSTFNDQYYPVAIIEFPNCSNRKENVHPTQKPVALMEYLIKTYTNEGEIVLDFTMGSGTTGVAAVNLKRDFIGIELDKGYFDIAQARIKAAEEAYANDS